MRFMLADFWLYLVLGAAFVAGYVGTREERSTKNWLAGVADLLFLAALPVVGLLFWRHGVWAGAAALLAAWGLALVGDQVHHWVYAPAVKRRPIAPRQGRLVNPAVSEVEKTFGGRLLGFNRSLGRFQRPQYVVARPPRLLRHPRALYSVMTADRPSHARR